MVLVLRFHILRKRGKRKPETMVALIQPTVTGTVCQKMGKQPYPGLDPETGTHSKVFSELSVAGSLTLPISTVSSRSLTSSP